MSKTQVPAERVLLIAALVNAAASAVNLIAALLS